MPGAAEDGRPRLEGRFTVEIVDSESASYPWALNGEVWTWTFWPECDRGACGGRLESATGPDQLDRFELIDDQSYRVVRLDSQEPCFDSDTGESLPGTLAFTFSWVIEVSETREIDGELHAAALVAYQRGDFTPAAGADPGCAAGFWDITQHAWREQLPEEPSIGTDRT